MKKYLVTGATGFLGSAVTAELLAHGAKVYALVLPDRVAVMIDRRELGEEKDEALYRRLLDNCSAQAFVQNKK